MGNIVGIRLEDKNKWERRTPIVPNHVKELISTNSANFVVQSSPIRAFKDSDYKTAGATISSDLKAANIIFAIKEVPVDVLEPNKVYIFFSHTVKGQKYNMPLLKRILEHNITLIDYEKIVNEKGFRMIYFGNYAGLAGMNQTLWAYGQRVKDQENIDTPFLKLKHTYEYNGLEGMKQVVTEVGEEIKKNGLHPELIPMIVGFAGYGNVSRGAQSILDLLPVIELDPTELRDIFIHKSDKFSSKHVYKVVFKEEHMVKSKTGEKFELQDYYKFGSAKYEGIFEQYIEYLSILINGIYWSEKYPRLLTKEHAQNMFQSKIMVRLQIIGDISCDVEGGIEPTLMVTEPDHPAFVYNPFSKEAKLGLSGDGLAIMAVDNLPCELPKESSSNFSTTLKPYIPIIAKPDYTVPFENLDLPPVIKNAVITHHGQLTPNYEYLKEFLEQI
ncbi:MAG: bifunctional lysine ketoglutarate reductase /saccharopine dehydrogenase family protein [Candidatus Hodarchaeales archaeon]|jgi:alpha-aminoadipic semialdehyde synthase